MDGDTPFLPFEYPVRKMMRPRVLFLNYVKFLYVTPRTAR